MKNPNKLRNVTAIALCLAATTIGANAQLGGALRNAANAAKSEVQKSANQAAQNAQNTANDAVNNATTQAPDAAMQATGSSASQPAQPSVQPGTSAGSATTSQKAQSSAQQQPWAVDKDRKGTIQATFADGVLTFKGTGEMFDFTITMRDDERPWAAHAKEITKAVVEEGITHLAGRAFYGCENLTSVSLPATLKNIRGAAFYGCKSLKTITLPQKLEYFDTGDVPDYKGSTNMVGLFGQCTALTEIKVADGNEKYKAVDGVLYVYFSTRWRLAAYPAGKTNASFNVPEQTPIILLGAFADNVHLKTIVMPESLGEIQGVGFWGCTALESITMKQTTGAVRLGVDVFRGVDMSKVKINVPQKVLSNYNTRVDSSWLGWKDQISGN
jgi:hypothetical protein